jgi:hypothetical protein
MTTLQFAVFFAALLVGYVLVHVRLVRFETYLREVSALKVMNERLKGLSDVLTRVDLEPVEDRLDLIGNELHSLVVIASRFEQAGTRERDTAVPPIAAPGDTAGERIRALVETRLLSLGYRNLHILTDLSAATFADELEVAVECEKNQMARKGKVITCNGEIRDVHMQSVAQTFP